VLDHNGAARAFVRRAWSDFDVSVPAPVIQMRLIGAAMFVVAIGGALIALTEAIG
jgi:hypothetical protein